MISVLGDSVLVLLRHIHAIENGGLVMTFPLCLATSGKISSKLKDVKLAIVLPGPSRRPVQSSTPQPLVQALLKMARPLVHLEEKEHQEAYQLLSQEFSQEASLALLELKGPKWEQPVVQELCLGHIQELLILGPSLATPCFNQGHLGPRHPTLENPGPSLELLEPRDPILELLEPTQEVLEPRHPILELPEPILELLEPTQEVLEPRHPILELPEPILELLEPTQEVLELRHPILELLEPILELPEPILELLEPRHPILELLEPTQEVLEPRHPILEFLEPTQEVLEPRHPILELLEHTLEVLEPRHPILELLEPTQEVLEPRHPILELLKPTQEVLEPRHPILELPGPNLELLGPRHPILELLEPTQEVLEPRHPILELPGPSLELLGPRHPILELLEPTQEVLGSRYPILELPGPSLEFPGPSLELPGPSLELLGANLKLLEPTQEVLESRHPILELPGPSLELPGPSLELPGPSLELPGPSLQFPGPSLVLPGPSLELLGPNLRSKLKFLELILEFLGARQFTLEAHLEFLDLPILVPLGLNQVFLGSRKDIVMPSLGLLEYRHTTLVPVKHILQATRYAETVDALRQLAQLNSLWYSLRDRINMLEQYKVNYSDLQRLQDFLTRAVDNTMARIPPNLQEQLAELKSMEEQVKDEKEKVDKIQRIVEGDLAAAVSMPIPEMAEEGAGQINMQIGYLRATVQEIEKELKELREKQDKGKVTLEQSVTDTALDLQEQLDKVRSVIENMMASSSTLLSMSVPPALSMSVPPALEPGVTAQVAQVQQSTCAACSLDVSEKVSQLFKRYEQLQDSINRFMLRQVEGKSTKKPKERQEEEMLSNIQSTILQIQEDCEKLNNTTGTLVDDHRQKQKEIGMLFKSLEKLEKNKADKDRLVMEIDVKADKSALAAKVSRTQFDATTEQLHKMMQELLNKMAGQEQDWQKMLDKLLIEMDSKLDRLELDPFRQQLEERWKNIRKELKERVPQDEGDEAAGIRRQLLAHFHCISCDRPLEMVVPGPHIPSLPAIPGLPAHPSLRPHLVYEMEQIRQISRNLMLGPGARFDALEKAASLNKLRHIHSKMLMEIQKVQSHYGGTPKVNIQMIRDLLQAQCLGSSQYSKRDKTPEMTDYSYISVPRHCGGSHTLTYPYRRSGRLQQLAQCMAPMHPEENALVSMMKHEEVDILGLDGHIYKGRMETQLPYITPKESVVYVPRSGTADAPRLRNKLIRSSSQKHQPTLPDITNLPVRPHSAKVSLRSSSGDDEGFEQANVPTPPSQVTPH
uniref:Uncharacterized protein n=1 Tax=Sphaerodactylus townsendi TaxID=933632 RepID=A0ACB8EKV3_9SAUR